MIKMVQGSKKLHDDTIDKLINRLNPEEYHQISKNVEYYNPGCKSVTGEIDAMAFKLQFDKSYLLLFEVKSTDSIKHYNKAVRQLNRSEYHYKNFVNRIFKFYVTPTEGGELNIDWIK